MSKKTQNKTSHVHHTTVTDPEETYVIINVSINNSPITIGIFYGPNTDFFKLLKVKVALIVIFVLRI